MALGFLFILRPFQGFPVKTLTDQQVHATLWTFRIAFLLEYRMEMMFRPSQRLGDPFIGPALSEEA